jgi:hydroxymethylglutaryl-CoA lyase
MMNDEFTIVECPRDAMQGLHNFIPTEKKVRYINRLLTVGFHTLDVGSFVSPKAIPQMRDTMEVLEQIEWGASTTKLLTIVANQRGVNDALSFPQVSYLGYPFSISETFQKRNTNKSIGESVELLRWMSDACADKDKSLVAYLSMGFGNPYGEEWSPQLLVDWAGRLVDMGIEIISLSDTVGVAKPADIEQAFTKLTSAFPEVSFGAHLHTPYDNWRKRVDAAYNGGCRRFDGAIRGLGGCPMAKDDLVGNMPTEKLVTFAEEKGIKHNLNLLSLESAYNSALQTFY